MKKILNVALVVIGLSACKGSADNKVPQLANEMCGCFEGMQKSLSPAALKIMKEVSTAEKPQEVLMKGMQQLNTDEAKAFAEQLKKIGEKDSEIMKCLNDFDKKHSTETTTDKKALTNKLLVELQKSANCSLGAAVVNLNPR